MRFFTLLLSLLFIITACNKDQSSPASSDQGNTPSTQETTPAPTARQARSSSVTAEALITQLEAAVELTEAQLAQIETIKAQYDLNSGKEEIARSFIKQVRNEVLTDAQRETYRASRNRGNR